MLVSKLRGVLTPFCQIWVCGGGGLQDGGGGLWHDGREPDVTAQNKPGAN